MNYENTILVIILMYGIYIFSKKTTINTKNTKNNISEKYEKFCSSGNPHKSLKDLVDTIYANEINYNNNNINITNNQTCTTPNTQDILLDLIKNNASLNKNFSNSQMHPKYIDVASALQLMLPEEKQIFNISNQPVDYELVSDVEVKDICLNFVKNINATILNDINVPVHKKSGWEKWQQSMGLTPMYSNHIKKQQVRMVAIAYVQKYSCQDEIKYACYLVLQKKDVNDQLILRVSFVINKLGVRTQIGETFWSQETIKTRSFIENIFTVGYLVTQNTGSFESTFESTNILPSCENYEKYDDLEIQKFTDKNYIQQILLKKHQQRSQEMNYRNSLLDEEGKDFNATLPNPYDYASSRGVRPIYDDMDYNRTYY